MAKAIEATIHIEHMEFPNKGVGYYNGVRTEIKNALPGQQIRALLKKKKGRYEGRALEVTKKAANEIEPPCESFPACGGCTFQQLSYDDELAIKRAMVERILWKQGVRFDAPLDIIPAPAIGGYRNKMEFSFGDEEKGGRLQLGMRKRNSYYEVAYGGCCNIADGDYRKIVDCVLHYFRENGGQFYHKATHAGILRHLIVRKGHFTGEIQVNLVTTSHMAAFPRALLDALLALDTEGEIAGVLHTVNDSVADVVKADNLVTVWGRDYFFDKLLGLTFRISPFSFFQTNSAGAEKLYATVREFTGERADKILFDLYCGTGTIAQVLSSGAKTVYGIELVEEAVAAANNNAAMNGITNCQFIAGDVLKKVPELLGENPHTIILDPPREGIHPKAIGSILKFGAQRIIYVSCKPTSLARDLEAITAAGYAIKQIRLHDMFPRSYHVESVVLLEKMDV